MYSTNIHHQEKFYFIHQRKKNYFLQMYTSTGNTVSYGSRQFIYIYIYYIDGLKIKIVLLILIRGWGKGRCRGRSMISLIDRLETKFLDDLVGNDLICTV